MDFDQELKRADSPKEHHDEGDINQAITSHNNVSRFKFVGTPPLNLCYFVQMVFCLYHLLRSHHVCENISL